MRCLKLINPLCQNRLIFNVASIENGQLQVHLQLHSISTMNLHLGSIESDYTKAEIDSGAIGNIEKAAC